jgi:hypothetical protein
LDWWPGTKSLSIIILVPSISIKKNVSKVVNVFQPATITSKDKTIEISENNSDQEIGIRK